MTATYYIWKWADNDLPGRPAEVVARLCAGELPPVLQAFRPRRVLDRLADVAAKRRSDMSEMFIEPQLDSRNSARFIHVSDPSADSPWLADKLLWAVWKANLTVFNETANRLVGLPKHNVVECPGGRQYVDIERADIPGLLHSLAGQPGLAAIACYDADGNMFQVWYHRRRYAVEWQVLPERDFKRHRIWVAGRSPANRRRVRLGPANRGLNLCAHEILSIADAHRLWVSFLAGPARPVSHVWRDVTQDLEKPGQPPRHRHTEKEEQPPL